MRGGLGNDTFVFLALSDSAPLAADTVADFAAGDRIDLSAIDANSATPANDAFHLGGTPGTAGDINVFYDATHGRTQVDLYVNNDASIDARIFISGDHHNLTAADFVL